MSRPKHARRPRRLPVLATAGVSAAAAISSALVMSGQAPAETKVTLAPPLDDAHVMQIALARVPAAAHKAGPLTYLVRPGDTLSQIAGEECGNPDDFRALAVNNGIRYADLINAGAVLKIACRAAAEALARVQLDPPASPAAVADPAPVTVADVQPARPAVTVSGGTLGCAGLESLWDAAGGNPQHAFMAAEIAMAESDGQQYAHSPTDDFGYWQINASNGALATYDALGNAKSAITLSGDGTNWGAWTTYTEGLYAGRC